MTRAPFLGLPVVTAASLFLVGTAVTARDAVADPTLGTGVPDMALFGLLFLGVVVLPAVALAMTCLGLALGGSRQLQDGRTGMLSTAAWLTLVGGGGIAEFSRTPPVQVLGAAAVGLCLVTLCGLDVLGRRTAQPTTAGA